MQPFINCININVASDSTINRRLKKFVSLQLSHMPNCFDWKSMETKNTFARSQTIWLPLYSFPLLRANQVWQPSINNQPCLNLLQHHWFYYLSPSYYTLMNNVTSLTVVISYAPGSLLGGRVHRQETVGKQVDELLYLHYLRHASKHRFGGSQRHRP